MPRSLVGLGSRNTARTAHLAVPGGPAARPRMVWMGPGSDASGSQAWARPSLPPWTRYRAETATDVIDGDVVWMTLVGCIVAPSPEAFSRAFHVMTAPELVPTASNLALW